MEGETLLIQEQNPKESMTCIETNIDVENNEENTLQVDVMAVEAEVEASQPAVPVYEALVPDLTLFSYDVQQGYRIFRELLSDQFKSITYPFIDPVDVEGMGLWDYDSRIKTPMSFSQIESKFKSYLYQSITEIVSDMRLILENCYRYNGSIHWISKLAQKLEKILDQKLALLNRSLREKVTFHATMAFRNKKDITEEIEEPGVRRRRSGRTCYVNGMSSDKTSSLMNHLMMEQEENEREIKRLKEKEKKEANEALMQELNEWENEMFTKNVLKELRSMWEIPTIGSFLWLFLPALNLPELNYTEFEHGFVLPHKSQQMAWIFTSLLVTPNQRKSLHKKSPMKFKVWERKLKERMDVWYLAKQDEELRMVALQIGLNAAFFEVLGETNPLETKSYIDLTLHQRVLILKILCDDCLDCQPQLRDLLGNADTTPYRETYLGYDGENSTYLYFPIFDATDIRIYKQAELPPLSEWYRKWSQNSKAASSSYQATKRTGQSKSRRSSTSKSSKKSKGLSTTVEPGFELVCNDVESLRELCEKFAEHPTPPSRKKARSRPTRKRSEKELHKVLTELVEELGKSDARYSKARVRGMLSLMKDWRSTEETSDAEDEFAVHGGGVEGNVGDSDPSPLDNVLTSVLHDKDIVDLPGEVSAPLLSMVTRSRKRKFLDFDDMTSVSSSPMSELSKNFESEFGSFDDSQIPRIEVKSEKHPALGEEDAMQQSVITSNEICEGIVRDVVNDVISKVCEMVLNGVDNDGLVGTTTDQNGKQEHSDDALAFNSNGLIGENTQGVSMANKVLQSIIKNSDTDGYGDTAMDIDGLENEQNHAISGDSKFDCSVPATNGNTAGDEKNEQNLDLYARTIVSEPDHELTHKNSEVNTCGTGKQLKSSTSSSSLNCLGIEEVTNIASVHGRNVYNNGHCGDTTNVSNGILSGSHAARKNAATVNQPTIIIPTKNEPTENVPTEKEPSGSHSVGLKSALQETGRVSNSESHNYSLADTAMS